MNKASTIYHDSKYDVSVENIVKKFNNMVAVKNVSFQVEKGQFFSLLGPSGCGKSTTLRALAGFVQPDKGEIFIKGKLMNHIAANRRPTNMVFQRLALFPHLTVSENIGFGLKIKKLKKDEITKEISDALELIQLSDYGNRRIDELSGGQQQRVAIARALVNEPDVLLLDEPLGALDLQLRLQMQVELKRIQETVGTTFIYVTHDQSEALTMSDKIAIMNQGEIMQVSSPKEIYEVPENSFVANFIGDTNLLQGKVTYVNGDVAKVRTATGVEITGVSRKEVKVGETVDVSIRLEHTLLDENGSNADNVFNGTVEEIIYQGSYTEYRVSITGHDSAQEISSRIMNGYSGKRLNLNDKVKISWYKDKTIVLRKNGGN